MDTHWGGFGAADSGFWAVRHGLESGGIFGGLVLRGDRELFRFQDGLVSCGTIDAMCGAYCFDRDSVTVFSLGVAGLENPRQLYLIHGTDGDRLCGSKDGSGETYFYRSQQAALEN